MSGHTPGPWVIAGDSYGGFNRIWAKVEGEFCDVASCVGDGSLTREEVAANERLISAAPDLLGAAKRLVLAAQDDLPEAWTAALIELEREIAKAEGK